jgi:hypothetical protein
LNYGNDIFRSLKSDRLLVAPVIKPGFVSGLFQTKIDKNMYAQKKIEVKIVITYGSIMFHLFEDYLRMVPPST